MYQNQNPRTCFRLGLKCNSNNNKLIIKTKKMLNIKKFNKFKRSTTFYSHVQKHMRVTSASEAINPIVFEKSHVDNNCTSNVQNYPDSQVDDPIMCHNNADDGFERPLDTSSDDDVDDDEGGYVNVCEELMKWALEFNIHHNALKKLLDIFNRLKVVQNIPKDPRTLLKSPRSVTVMKMGSGEYWHNGLKTCLLKCLSNINSSLLHIKLNINIDGLPIYRSSKKQFWPILFSIDGSDMCPMVIGMFYGESKPPTPDEFLMPFVEEMLEVLRDGIIINDFKVNVTKIRSFICDTPARSYIKGTVNFNAYSSCIKCTVIGQYYDNEHRMSFARTDMSKRTDESFRLKIDPDHHKINTPLERLPIDMVKDFPVGDSLHLIDLGITRRFLSGWTTGSLGFRTKWSALKTKAVSDLLVQSKMPLEIHRAVRGLDCLSHWKGTEYRTFLLYLGPVLLKDFLDEETYHHFMLLFCAVVICFSKCYFKYLDIAEKMFLSFIDMYIRIYGIHAITSNVHNLCHVVDEVKHFGTLDTFNAYSFENALQTIKKQLRTGNQPLRQVAKRISENYNNLDVEDTSKNRNFPNLKKKNCNNCDDNEHTHLFSKIEVMKGLTLGNDARNMWFLTKNNEIVKMKNAKLHEHQVQIFGSSLIEIKNFFETPIESRQLNIYRSNKKECPPRWFAVTDIKCKLVAVEYHNDMVYFPLIHTLDTCAQ